MIMQGPSWNEIRKVRWAVLTTSPFSEGGNCQGSQAESGQPGWVMAQCRVSHMTFSLGSRKGSWLLFRRVGRSRPWG